MHRLFIFLILLLCSQSFYAQIDLNFNHSIDVPIPNYSFERDSSATSFQILQIPFTGFNFMTYSNPNLNNFVSKSGEKLVINLHAYKESINSVSHHLLDLENILFYYAQKKDNAIHSYGLTHRLLGEFSMSGDFISLIVDGNYPNLNKTIHLDNNYARLYNYFSFFYGYANTIGDRSLFGFKFKLLKGFGSFGVDNRELSILVSDNFGTEENPFSSRFNTDLNYFVNSDYSILSNLGCAVDLELQYKLNDHFSLYTEISELGFISWREDRYVSQGSFNFDGIDYALDEDLITEFNNIYDTIVDIFDIKENHNIKSIRLLPFEFNIGCHIASSNVNNFFINYNVKKLYNSLLHTASVAYAHYFESAKLSVIPSYSLNKFNYTSFTLYVNKSLGNRLSTNLYFKNILGFLNNDNFGINQSLGVGGELLLSF